MAGNRNECNRVKLKGALDERINNALYEIANCPDVVEVLIPDKPIKHLKSPRFEIKGVYTTVAGAVVRVALLGPRGYGKVVDVISTGITGARNVAEYIYNLKRRDPLEYFPAV